MVCGLSLVVFWIAIALELKASPSDLNPVLVRDSSAQFEKSFGRPVDQKITEQDLKNRTGTSITDIVDLSPGLENLGGPRREAQAISIRAFQPKQILYLLDGTRLNFRMTHNAVFPVRFHLLKEIDIAKGSASGRFGNGAVGGLIQLTTKDPTDLLIKSKKGVAFETGGIGASQGESGLLSFTGATRLGSSWAALVDYTQGGQSDLTLSDNSTLPYSALSDDSVFAKLQGAFSDGSQIKFTAEELSKDSVTPFNPSGEDLSDAVVGNQKERLRSTRIWYSNPNLVSWLPNWTTTAYQSETQLIRARLTDQRSDLRRVLTNGFLTQSRYEGNWGASRYELSPGFEFYSDQNEGDRNGLPLSNFPDGRSETRGWFLTGQVTLASGLWAAGGIREDSVSLVAESLDVQRRDFVTPEFEIGTPIGSRHSLSFANRRGFNAPRVQDLFVDGLHFSDGFQENYFIPNPNLQPETSNTFELKWSWDFTDRWVLQWTEYQTTLENYIDQEVRFFDQTTQFVNRPLVDMRGREVFLQGQYDKYRNRIGYSAVRATQTSSGQPLSNAPADQFFVQIEYLKKSTGIGIESQWFFAQNLVDRTVVGSIGPTPAFDLQNITWSQGFRSEYLSDIAMVFRVNNVFDRKHRRHGSPILGLGRDFRLELRARFF